MRLENRIQNIKKLLSYCPKSTNDVMLSDDILCKFFWKFFSSKPERFNIENAVDVFNRQCLLYQ